MPYWTKENDDKIANLLQEGFSASQIGAAIGVTRNAIIGRVSRDKALKAIGFKRMPGMRKTGTVYSPKPKRKTEPKPKPPKRKTIKVSPSILFEPKPSIPLPVLPPLTNESHLVGMHLLMLREGMCKWPVNDARKGEQHLFCGSPSEGTFCKCHHSIAYRVVRENRQDSHSLMAA